MGYSVATWYRIVEKKTVSGKSKFYPQVSDKENIWFYREWNYYKGGLCGNDRLCFDTMEEAKGFVDEIKGSKVVKTLIHDL